MVGRRKAGGGHEPGNVHYDNKNMRVMADRVDGEFLPP